MSYVVIGAYTHEQYGQSFSTRALAWQYVNRAFEKDVRPAVGTAWTEHSKLDFPEPVAIVCTDRPLEGQMPYAGKNSRAYHMRKNDEWHQAHRVRERIG